VLIAQQFRFFDLAVPSGKNSFPKISRARLKAYWPINNDDNVADKESTNENQETYSQTSVCGFGFGANFSKKTSEIPSAPAASAKNIFVEIVSDYMLCFDERFPFIKVNLMFNLVRF
jgi:hypothetical protein